MNQYRILLADDDEDDCLLFKEALDELCLGTQLTTVPDGEQLMQLLAKKTTQLPHVLFLDLNMPRKNGQECLAQIKRDPKLKHLTVIIFSTAFDALMADRLYKDGATNCIRKPPDFGQLKQVIRQVVTRIGQPDGLQPQPVA